MVDPAGSLSWCVADGAPPAVTRRLAKVIEIAAYWAAMWQPFARAAIGRPVRFVVAAGDAPVEVSRSDADDGIEARIWLPGDTPRPPRTAAFTLLDAALYALEISAQRWPAEAPETLPETLPKPDGEPLDGPRLSVAMLQSEELLLITGVPGRADGGEALFHALDDYVIDRVEEAGVGVVDDLTIDDPFIEWIIVLDE